jgi:hypothetical protein
MRVFWKFLRAELIWTTAIFLLIVPITILSGDAKDVAIYLRWLGRGIGLAAFPAGIAVAGDVFATPFRWRPLLFTLLGASLVAFLVLEIFAFVVPILGGQATLVDLMLGMRNATASWEVRNDAAWRFYSTLLTPVTTLLHAAIGVMVGIWAGYALPPAFRRLLYWLVGLGLLVSGYSVFDTTYESIVLHTAAPVEFAAFYTLLVPLGICAGLGLPTLALVRGAEVRGSAT